MTGLLEHLLADPPTILRSPFVRTAAAAFGILLLALLWSNSRILGLRRYQDPAGPTVLLAYYVYHGMALALAEGGSVRSASAGC